MTAERNMVRIVMVVSNPATTDYRVVKSAKMAARAGFDCHVVGILQPGYSEVETVDGVTYHRVGIKTDLRSLMLGICPSLVHTWVRESKPETIRARSNTKPSKPGMLQGIRRWILRFLGKVRRQARSNIRAIFYLLRPQWSGTGVRFLMGRYLNCFYPKLLELNADIYHAHELWTLESCSLVAERLKATLVYDSHELESHRNNAWSKRSNRVRIAYENRYIGTADVVISVSEGCARTIEEIYSLGKVYLLRNTPLLGEQRNSRESLRSAIGLDANTPLLVYTGSVTTHRGLEIVLTSLQELDDFHLVTVGPCDTAIKKDLLKLANKLGVSERFHVQKKVPPEELIDFISSADMAVVPIQDACLSYRYCMPNKLFEAAFSGLPMVTSNLPDMSKFVEENDLGATFEWADSRSLTSAVLSVYNNRENFVSKYKTRELRNKYCFEQESEVLISAYRRLLDKKEEQVVGCIVEQG